MIPAEFVSVADAARALAVSDDLIYDLVDRGELPCTQFGRRKLIPRRAIELVIERAMANFDPDALLITLAGAAGPSSAAGPPNPGADTAPESVSLLRSNGVTRVEGSTGPTGSEAIPAPGMGEHAAPSGAPVSALRR